MTTSPQGAEGQPVRSDDAHRLASSRTPQLPAVRIEQLTKSYRGVRVLDAVDAQFPPGEVVLISGGNGTGKSTLIRAIAGLVKPSSGRVEIGPRPDGRPGRVAASFEEPIVYSGLSVRDTIEVISGQRVRDSADERLALYTLSGSLKKTAARLSFGQRRRVILTALLCADVETVVFDDPLNGLDADGAEAFQRQCQIHRAMGQLVIITGPTFDGARLNPDKHLTLRHGRLSPVGADGREGSGRPTREESAIGETAQ